VVNPSTVDPTLEPMLRIQVDDDPTARAGQLAEELGADLRSSEAEAVALLEELSAFPPLGADALDQLRGLSDRVTAARRIVERTTDRAAADVAERFAASGLGLAVHPVAVRDRAASVVAAREALQGAEERLAAAEADDETEVAIEVDPPEPLPPVPARAEPPPRRRRWFGRARERRYEEGVRETTSLLHEVMANTEEAFGARRASEARTIATDLLRAQRDRALEDVRMAEHSWRDLAGDADVEDVDVVVKRFDPQHQEALVVAEESVGVRAVGALLQQAISRWDEGWRSVGLDPPESVDPEWVDQMAERMTQPVVLVGGATAYAEQVLAAAPAVPVLAIEAASPS
jgi:hypothetical protein